jgi:N-acetylglucosaminyl-diphospho-decaprenol L-rhamnosyltransferase
VTATVEAVVVDYDVGGPLVDCVASLRAERVGRIVVVDNGGGAAASRSLRRAGLEVPVVNPGRNVGYGAGANRGVSALGQPGDEEYVLVSNADLRVHPGAIRALCRALDADASLAIVGPRILTPDGAVYPSARRFPSPVDAAGHALLGLLRPDNRFSRRYRDGARTGADREGGAVPVDWVSGSCFLVRRRAFEELGGFDESFFMYAEDLDLCWRAGRRGWGVAFVPNATVTHIQGVSTDRRPYRMLLEHHRSAWRFARRSTGGWRRLLLPAAALLLAGRLVLNVGMRLVGGAAPR